MRPFRIVPALLVPALAFAEVARPAPQTVVGPPAPLVAAPWRSGSALVFDESIGRLWAVDPDRGSLAGMDLLAGGRPLEEKVGAEPVQMVLGADGSVFVTVRREGTLVKVGPMGVERSLPLGGEPWGLARSDDGETVFVTCATGDEVVAVDARTLMVLWRQHVPAAPRAIAFVSGERLAVGHLKGRAVTMLDGRTGAVLPPLELVVREDCGGRSLGDVLSTRLPRNQQLMNIDFGGLAETPNAPAEGQALRTIRNAMPAPRVPCEAARAHAMVSFGDELLVFHDDVNPGTSGTRPSGGYGGAQFEFPVVARVTRFRRGSEAAPPLGVRFAVEAGTVPASVVGAALLPHVRQLAIAARGSDQVALMGGEAAPFVSYRAVEATGGPVAVAANHDGSKVFVLSAFDREIRTFEATTKGERALTFRSLASIEAGNRWQLARVERAPVMKLADSPLAPEIQRGRRLFHRADARISSVGFACASCHPDGREDGLVWSIEGGRRQTPSLAARLAGTAPYNWEGSEVSLEGNIRQTIRRLRGNAGRMALEDADVRDLAAYLMALPAPVNPHREVDPARTALVERGREVFEGPTAGCADCHVPTRAFTDGEVHDVGTVGKNEQAGLQAFSPRKAAAFALDTPSLRDLALTGPYLHDGSATSLDEVLTKTDGEMGTPGKLAPDERAALLAYLETL